MLNATRYIHHEDDQMQIYEVTCTHPDHPAAGCLIEVDPLRFLEFPTINLADVAREIGRYRYALANGVSGLLSDIEAHAVAYADLPEISGEY